MIVEPRLASAVMLLRDHVSGQGIEVFMLRRVIQSDFMPDVYVFPGGSVTDDDRAAEQTEGVSMRLAPFMVDLAGPTALGSGTRAAALRELFEEAGILLAYHAGNILAMTEEDNARFRNYRQAFHRREGSLVDMARAEDVLLATDQLSYFAHWITPEGMPKRFDTHFFLAAAPGDQEAVHDHLETSEGVWIQPAEALARAGRGEFPLVFATVHQLRELAAFGSVKEAVDFADTHPVETHVPVLIHERGKTRVYLAEDQSDSWDVPESMTKIM